MVAMTERVIPSASPPNCKLREQAQALRHPREVRMEAWWVHLAASVAERFHLDQHAQGQD